jgi:hypothetical protein
MSNKPRSKRHQTLIDKYGGQDGFRDRMQNLARKGGQAKVPKGFSMTRMREEMEELDENPTRQ